MSTSRRVLSWHRLALWRWLIFVALGVSWFLAPTLASSSAASSTDDPAVLATIPVAGPPTSIAVNGVTNRIYVAIPSRRQVAVIDGASNAVAAIIDFSDLANSYPSSVAVNLKTNQIYVGDTNLGTVTVIDGATNARVATIPNVGNVWQVAVGQGAQRVFAASTDSVAVIDPTTNSLLTKFTTGLGDALSVPASLTADVRTNRLFDLNGSSGFISVRDGISGDQITGILIPRVLGQMVTADLTVSPATDWVYAVQTDNLVVANQDTAAVIGVVGLSGFTQGNGVALNLTTGHLLVPVSNGTGASQSGALDVVDARVGAVVAILPLGTPASAVDTDYGTNRVYVGGAQSPTVTVVSDPPGGTNQPVLHDARYFPQTGYRVDDDTIWDYFNRRGGLSTFGYPVSRTFLFQGFLIQMFQRRIIQLDENGAPRLLNLLDPGLLPYTSFNGAVVPAVDPSLVSQAPNPTDSVGVLAYVRANAPDAYQGLPVRFSQTFDHAVPYDVAFPIGGGNPGLLPGFDLEMWGVPTSQPAFDPHNHGFVYLRWQRGIMMYDASCDCTQGILLADYLKSILTGQNLPNDLRQEAQGSPFFQQYDPTIPGWVRDRGTLPGTDLTNAFVPE